MGMAKDSIGAAESRKSLNAFFFMLAIARMQTSMLVKQKVIQGLIPELGEDTTGVLVGICGSSLLLRIRHPEITGQTPGADRGRYAGLQAA